MVRQGRARDRALWLLLGASVLTVTLYFVPYGRFAVYPLVLLSTFAHELGHGLTAEALGGQFTSLTMHADGSGYARFQIPSSRLAHAATAAGGLVGPAVLAWVFFVLARSPKLARSGLVGFGIVSLVALVAWVRGSFGVVFVLALGVSLLAVGWKAKARVSQWVLVFLAVQLSLSVFSRGDYLFREGAGSGPSDVAQMANALWLPFWFWGLACGALSVVVLWMGIGAFLRRAT